MYDASDQGHKGHQHTIHIYSPWHNKAELIRMEHHYSTDSSDAEEFLGINRHGRRDEANPKKSEWKDHAFLTSQTRGWIVVASHIQLLTAVGLRYIPNYISVPKVHGFLNGIIAYCFFQLRHHQHSKAATRAISGHPWWQPKLHPKKHPRIQPWHQAPPLWEVRESGNPYRH